MIRVELRTSSLRFGAEVVAVLEVMDDGRHRLTGSRKAVNLSDQMLSFPGPQMLSFYDDPHRWARALPHNLTSPYLHAVIVHETPRAPTGASSAAG